jgi:DNA-binding transcriptional LysR family regulator
MDLHALRIFKAVVEEGGVARAAERLHCVQSNVSTRLAQFEKRLDVKLFHRAGNKLVLTQDGVRLLGYAERLLQLADEAELAVTAKGLPVGMLRIASMETTAALRLPPILADFHARHPQVDLDLFTGPSATVVDQVLEGRRDVGLVAGPVNGDLLNEIELFEEELVLVTDLRHPPVSAPADVRNRTILAFRAGCAYRTRLEHWFEKAGVKPQHVIEVGGFETIVACVAAGMGVTMMPAALLVKRNLLSSVRMHPVPPRIGRTKTLLVWRRDAGEHGARDAFIDTATRLVAGVE